jgi:hypothetical protein
MAAFQNVKQPLRTWLTPWSRRRQGGAGVLSAEVTASVEIPYFVAKGKFFQ